MPIPSFLVLAALAGHARRLNYARDPAFGEPGPLVRPRALTALSSTTDANRERDALLVGSKQENEPDAVSVQA